MTTPEWLRLIADRIELSPVLILASNRENAKWQHKLSVERRNLLASVLRAAAERQ
ncbi:MAG TPA: hypothetical protein VNY06_01110 [Methylocella sp.]|nr:hypothetical protein [Methylocella sp.]